LTQFSYAAPRVVTSLDECYFYHTISIPEFGVVQGEWDLRPGLDAYLGGCDLKGKRVLDVGAASGILSFHAEAKGAEVVSFDLNEDYTWDLVPFATADAGLLDGLRRAHLRRINNGYWLCHRAFQSKARAVYGVVYDIPREIGAVDIAIYGSILLHLRDPFLALENGARLAREAIVVTDIVPWKGFGAFLRAPRFLPDHRRSGNSDTWWSLPPRLIREYLAILGFENSTVTWHRQTYRGRKRLLYTVTSRRTRG
jgi:SAM-dependent methyltransferase